MFVLLTFGPSFFILSPFFSFSSRLFFFLPFPFFPSDVSYNDPVGELPQRPKTAARAQREEEEWNEEIGDDLLPD